MRSVTFLLVLLNILFCDARSLSPRSKLLTPVSVSSPDCKNGPKSRGCWEKDRNITTDWDVDWPRAGNVVEVGYWVYQ